jgi:hypothetical protein
MAERRKDVREHSTMRWLVPVLAALTMSAACGDGAPTPADDKATADKASLQAADFPAGWKSEPHEKLPGEDEMAAEIAKCLGVSSPSTRATAQVRSADFSSGLATQASAVITFVKTEKEASADAAAFGGAKFPECATPGFTAQVQRVAPEGATVDGLKITKIAFPASGDHTAAHRVEATIRVGEMPVPINIDLVHIVKGRAEVQMTFVNPGAPFPEDLSRSLSAKIVERL